MEAFKKGLKNNELNAPVTSNQIRKLRDSDLVSVRVGNSHGVRLPDDLCNEAQLEENFQELLKAREDIENDVFPKWFMEKYAPSDWGDFPEEMPEPLALAHEIFNIGAPLSYDNPKGLAQVVRMDHPSDFGRVIIDWLLDNGATLKVRKKPEYFEFVEIVQGSYSEMNSYVHNALNQAFEIKYEYMVQRPEEYAGENLTQYEEGCPPHPSFPAGHGAAAFATIQYFFENWVLTDEQKQVLFWSAYIWAMSRSLAFVHWAVDNLTFAPRRANV